MSLEERLEKAEKLVAEVKAELAAMRATKRNWPERIEQGQIYKWKGQTYITAKLKTGEFLFVNLNDGHRHAEPSVSPFARTESEYEYLGHARDILTIRTDAHEPTGEGLVGKVCEFADLMSGPWSPGECAAFGQNPAYPYRKAGGAEWKYARLAK